MTRCHYRDHSYAPFVIKCEMISSVHYSNRL